MSELNIEQGPSIAKLTTGEEVIGRCEIMTAPDGNRHLVMNDPMTLQNRYSPDGTAALVMVRYNPFIRGHNIVIHGNDVVFLAPISEELAEYYELSVAYCNKYSDSATNTNVKQASSYLKRIIAGEFDNEKNPLDEAASFENIVPFGPKTIN